MLTLQPSDLERWYNTYGFRARYNLSSSAAPALSTAELLALGGPQARDEYLQLDLNYPPQPGTLRLRQAIAALYTGVDVEHIQVTTGAAEALFLMLAALVQPGSTLVVQFPIYPSITALTEGLGARVLHWPLLAHGCDLDALEQLLHTNTVRGVILNHPHSPTGALLSTSELQIIARLCRESGALLVIDEVYRGIQFAGEPAPAAVELGPGTVSIGDLAKPYGLGGLRVGWIATRDEALLARCAELRDYTSLCNSAPGEFLAALALEHHTALISRHLAQARTNRALFTEAMPLLPWLDSQLAPGGFTIFPAVRTSRPTTRICHELCESHDVLLLPGDVFGMAGYVRLGFGVDSAQFATGLERLMAYRP